MLYPVNKESIIYCWQNKPVNNYYTIYCRQNKPVNKYYIIYCWQNKHVNTYDIIHCWQDNLIKSNSTAADTKKEPYLRRYLNRRYNISPHV